MRYELMLPHQIRTAIDGNWPVVLPLGVLEYHGEHMAVGMDTLAVTRILEILENEANLVILPPFSAWEMLMLFRGQPKTAFRRFLSRRKGAPAHVEGFHFRCWYYSASFVKKIMAKASFGFLGQEGLCTLVPPSYIEHFAERHPRSWRFLSRLEDKWKSKWPWRAIGDYYIVSFRKK